MALDAAFLTYITRQLNETLAGSTVDKIYQPSKDEVMLHFRGKKRVMISCSPNAARIHLTERAAENPKTPPGFCMVLRKHLAGARLERVEMPTFERVITLRFQGKNDFFEPVERTLLLEIMGRTSNIILLDEHQKILDAAKHVDFTMTRHRQILPGLYYEMPPRRDKTDFMDFNGLPPMSAEKEPAEQLMDAFAGISPVVAREICHRTLGRHDALTPTLQNAMTADIRRIVSDIRNGVWAGCIVQNIADGKNIDFSFLPLRQYGDCVRVLFFDTPSALLEEYYTKSAQAHRLRQKSSDLLTFLTRTEARIRRTMHVREKELESSRKADIYQKYGTLLQSEAHRVAPGQRALVTTDYYDPALPEITIPLSPEKSASANAAAYFKKYTKAKNGRTVIAELLKKDAQMLEYLESVLSALCDAENEADIEAIRSELIGAGLLKKRGAKQTKAPDLSHPRRFVTDDGYTVLVGKNNLQNDYLTVRLSRRADIWLHTKDIHGSHVLLVTGGTPLEALPDRTLLQAASLAAYYSKGKQSGKVSVDYCPVSHVKKPTGARPGMVVYEGYYTVVVSPDASLVDHLRQE